MYSGGYKNLMVWKKAIAFSVLIYNITKHFPSHELYGLTSQMRRSGISIASNIAEGCARHGNKEFAQFLGIAGGLLAEVLTQAEIAKAIGILPEESYLLIDQSGDEIGRMLSKLKTSLTMRSTKPQLVSSND